MRLAIRKASKDDESMGVMKGDMLLVNLEYDWDPEKVEVMCKLVRGSGPDMSEYKTSLTRVSAKELREYLGEGEWGE